MSIIVQRDFRVAPADQAEFERQSAQGLWPTFLHFGALMLAYGNWAFGGRTDEVTTNTAYEDFDHWLATRPRFQGRPGAFYEDEAMMAETADLRTVYAQRGRLVSTSRARIIEVDDEASDTGARYRRAGMPVAEPPPTLGRGSVISERTYSLADGARPEFVRLSQEHIWPWLEGQRGRLIAFGSDPLGASGEVITLFAFRSLADWQRLSRPSPQLEPPPPVSEAWGQRAGLIERHEGRLLVVGTDFGAAV